MGCFKCHMIDIINEIEVGKSKPQFSYTQRETHTQTYKRKRAVIPCCRVVGLLHQHGDAEDDERSSRLRSL